jgi:hypothetical protein
LGRRRPPGRHAEPDVALRVHLDVEAHLFV